MASYDLYAMAEGGRLVIDVQADLLDVYSTRIVVPLLEAEAAPGPIRKLNPVIDVGGQRYVLAIQLLAAVPVAALRPRHLSLAAHREQIVAALDMLFLGF